VIYGCIGFLVLREILTIKWPTLYNSFQIGRQNWQIYGPLGCASTGRAFATCQQSAEEAWNYWMQVLVLCGVLGIHHQTLDGFAEGCKEGLRGCKEGLRGCNKEG